DEKKKVESAAAALELLPKYRDRAKERREDQNPDYEPTANDFGAFHVVAPLRNIDLFVGAKEKEKLSEHELLEWLNLVAEPKELDGFVKQIPWSPGPSTTLSNENLK
ncbi:suppressor of mec-8 and unc-52 protein homolog 2, partial [Tanacetum coccineum]